MNGSKWFQDNEGKVSAMRIIAMRSVQTGILLVVAGIAFGVAGIIKGQTEIFTFAATCVGAGVGVQGVALGMKAWQTKSEQENL